MEIEIGIAANGIMAVAQTPTTIALMGNDLKAAIDTVAMRTNVTGMQGKVDGAVNTAGVVLAAVAPVAVNMVTLISAAVNSAALDMAVASVAMTSGASTAAVNPAVVNMAAVN